MKRVLQVVGKMNIGGAEQLLMNVYRNIDRTKVQFDFLTFYGENESGYFDEEIKSLGGNIINIKPPKPFDVFSNIVSVRQVLKTKHYDAIHTHIGNNAAFALIAAKKEGVPIRIAHSHNVNKRSGSAKYYDLLLKNLLNRNITACAACSKEAAEYRFSKKHIENDYIYVPNSVDFSAYLKEYDTQTLRNELGIKLEQKMLVQVGNFKWQKNQDFAVELLNRELKNENIVLVFAGRTDDEYAEKVKKKINDYGLGNQVRLLGQREDIPALMNSADALLMPSIQEGLGIVLVEAQAAGLPSVVSDIIQPEADLGVGLVQKCELGDFKSWKESIQAALNAAHPSLEQREEYLRNSNFDLEKTVKCFETLYKV